MKYEMSDQINFLSEMSERQISAQEFFSNVLVESLARNFELDNLLISFFDTNGKFNSWSSGNGAMVDCEEHEYRKIIKNDVIRHQIFQDAVRDRLTYFNVEPRVYKSTDIINSIDYNNAAYVRFLREHFHAHYSATMAFGINAYIQISFFKCMDKGDFTENEMDILNKIYVCVANAYKNFKKHEQAKIVSCIQNKIISSGAKAYLVTDEFMNVMSFNQTAQLYLKDIWGETFSNQIEHCVPCQWLSFLLEVDKVNDNQVVKSIIKDHVFSVHTYDQKYSNGIIDRYHWITINKNDIDNKVNHEVVDATLTKAELRVAQQMYNGLTYKNIADELVVSYHTIKKHVQNIYTKCGVKNRLELYKWLESTKK